MPEQDPSERVTELEAQVLELRQQLWEARDAAMGATATAGSYRARNTELEMLVQQLRNEIARLDRALTGRRASTLPSKVKRAVRDPGAVARRLLR